MRLLKKRLEYDYVDAKNNKRVVPSVGIPQSGIDSPYLFNIYLLELDEYVQNDLQHYLNELNEQKGFGPSSKYARIFKPRKAVDSRFRRRMQALDRLKRTSPDAWRSQRRSIQKEIRFYKHRLNSMTYYDGSLKRLRLFYVRYADDWILLTNGGTHVAEGFESKDQRFSLGKARCNSFGQEDHHYEY